MQKRDFIQQACIQFMPETQWDMDKSLRYAEKLWDRLSEKGYGELKQRGPNTPKKAYDLLSPNMKAAFDLFWLTFDLKTASKDKAAGAWLALGNMPKDLVDKIIYGAKQAAAARKTLPPGQIPKHPQGWLNDRDWLSWEESTLEQNTKADKAKDAEINKLMGDLAHAKKMATMPGISGDGNFWQGEADRLTEQLRLMRG